MSELGKVVPHRTRARDEEDEGRDVKHFMAEPGNDHDDFFGAEGTPGVNDSEYASGTRRGGEGYENILVNVSDTGRSRDVNRHASIRPSTEDYHIDTEFVDEDSDCEDFPRVRVSFEKSSFETHSSSYSGSESRATGGSESSSTSDEKPQSGNGKYAHQSFCKLHGVSKKKCECQDQMKEMTKQNSPILYTSQNRRRLQSRLGLMCGSDTSEMKLTSVSHLHQTSEVVSLVSNHKKTYQSMSAAHSTERLCGSGKDTRVDGSSESGAHTRSRKPPVRYIDEFSGSMSFTDEKHGISGTARNRTKDLRTASELGNGNKALKSFKLARHEGFYGQSPLRSSITISNACGISKEFSPVTTLDSDEESQSDEPEKVSPARTGSKICGDRRKHQMIWTLPEVEKLMDGISHYGVGRWTEIQRVFFPSSTYRTPIDLRDKWRNLLKASDAWMQNDQEKQDAESQKSGHRLLSKEILHRISELGRLHPYPVKRNLKHVPAPTPTPMRSSRK